MAVPHRHHHVHQNGVKAAHRRGCKSLHRLLSVGGFCHLYAHIVQQKFHDLHVQGVVLGQQHLPPTQHGKVCLLLLRLCGLGMINSKGQGDGVGGAYALLAFHPDSAADLIHKAFGDGHSKAGAAVYRACPGVLLRKGHEHPLLELLAHADAGGRADKTDLRLVPVAAQFKAVQHHPALFPVILDGIAEHIHQQPLDVQRAAHQPGMRQPAVLPVQHDAALCRLFFRHVRDLVHQLGQIKGHVFQHHLAGLQLAHVQHLVHQLQQQGGSLPDLFAAVSLPRHILRAAVADLHHTPDAVDGGADIVAHALQKLGLGKVCALRLQRSRLEGLLVLLLPAQLLLPVAPGGLHIAHGRDIYLLLRAVNIDVKTASLPHNAVGVLLPGGAVHMDHAAVCAARF